MRKPECDGAGGYRIPPFFSFFFFLSLPTLTFSLKARSDLSLTSLDSAGCPAAKFISGSECEGGQRINAARLGPARGQIKQARSQVGQIRVDECDARAYERSLINERMHEHMMPLEVGTSLKVLLGISSK